MNLTLWSGTLGQRDFDTRLDCAARAGYQAMSVFPWDCRAPHESCSKAAELRRRADDRGIVVRALDPFAAWLPSGSAAFGNQADFSRLFASYQPAEIYTMASELGAGAVCAIGPMGRTPSLDEVSDRFAAVCAEAATYGLRVQLEFMPFTGIPDLQFAWQVVSAANAANGGLLIDIWHFRRSGSTLADLAEIPPDRLFTVQLSDGPAEHEQDLWKAAAHDRRLPGTGQLDVVGFLRAIRAMGAKPDFGPEVVSDFLRAVSDLEAADLAGETSRRVLQEAGF